MTNKYDAMSADALRLAIAKLRGYRVWPWNNQTFHLVFPSGKVGHSDRQTEFAAWMDSPDWPNDIAAAWELVEEMRATNPVEVGTGSPYFCRVFDEQYVFTVLLTGEGDTAPLAICRAYLEWKDRQG